ncbi:transposable element Tc1 transposase [Trichonephila clavipes]|nr:transposable element Tc1 transposase [Trichonephila clavipes]
MINGRTRLHVVANGTMTCQRYIDEVLLPHVRLLRGAVGDNFVFMGDNAICHRTLTVQDCLDSEGIHHLVWPARSPDLSPIENVWDTLGRQVAGRNYPPTNKNTLIHALPEEWDKLPQQLLDNVVQSMQRFQDDGIVSRCYSTGRPRVTTPNEDRYIWQLLPKETDGAQHQTCLISSLQLPVRQCPTVYRRLGPIGLHARRTVRCVPLTATHNRLRLTWSREHALWTPQQWSCVMFSDEFRYSLQYDSHRILICRAPDTRYDQENTIERHCYGGAG